MAMAPEVVGGEDRLEELGAVVREERHDVARPDPALGQATGQRGHAAGHLPVGRGLSLEHRDHLVRRPLGVVGEHVEPVHVRRSHRRGVTSATRRAGNVRNSSAARLSTPC